MFKKILILTLFVFQLIFAKVSIHDIQYTTIPGENNYYPSLYNDQTVETGGIVSAVNFDGKSYFISSSKGGAWSGLFIYDASHKPEIGDSIILTGDVYEYHGTTELKSIQSYETISKGNILQNIPQISTNDVSSEPYENCIVKINELSVVESYDSWDEWTVDDGSGQCKISTGFINLKSLGISLESGLEISKIIGIVSFSYGDFRLNPRDLNDVVFNESGYFVSTPSNDFYNMTEIQIPVEISTIISGSDINKYQLNFHFDSEIVEYAGFSKTNTISDVGTINESINNNEVQLDFEGSFNLIQSDTLVFLNFNIISSGVAEIILDSCIINEIDNAFLSSGLIYIGNNDPIGDTLTIIQKPILNVPEIVVPGETMEIFCLAGESTTDWKVELCYGNIKLNLQINSSNYTSETNQWNLSVTIPTPELYELYDLHVTASGSIDDITENAVSLIRSEKDKYYFVHITDTHLPTHTFFSSNEIEAVNDTSELQDLRDVINDINLINPEFVLITGDLINEGELEDFMNGRVYTKSQKLLTELEVPFFLVGGNHDLGGWVATPPKQGTARHDWWRFFGWKWLQTSEKHTQDYIFSYGNTKYIGMEAYDNYDEYMFDIYGDKSFTENQLNWLQTELDNSTNFSTKVLFYHNDFSNQINLSSLDVDMALYGHIHRNNGNENTIPYNLATDNVCDGQRAYRIIEVNNDQLRPFPTLYVNDGNENLNIDFTPANDGLSNTVTATISNQHDLDFENAKIKFKMPKNSSNYEVSYGKITQIDKSGEFDICYVEFNLPTKTDLSITLNSSISTGLKKIHSPENYLKCYPNPFNNSTTIEYSIQKQSPVELSIYNINGQKIKTLVNETKNQGEYHISWSGDSNQSNIVSAGVYFYEIISKNYTSRKQMVFLK